MKGEPEKMKPKKIKITLSQRESAFFPIEARWTINSVKYSAVFETEARARSYFNGKYIYTEIVTK